MPINRRHFLKAICASLISSSLASCTHKKFFNPDEDILLSGGHLENAKARQNVLTIINLTQQEKRLIDTPFLAHGMVIDPNNKYRVFCFEKNAGNACTIDLQTQSVSATFNAETNQLFSGHACFSLDGKKIICIESNKDTLQGSITIRDSKTFELIRQLPTLGLSPHDCQLTKDNILTVSNTGRSESGFHQPSLVSINLNTEKLVERIKLDTQDLNCGHFNIAKNDALVIASAPIDSSNKTLPGGVSLRNHDGILTTMTEPELVIKRMTGEALGIEIHQQQQIAAITHPQADLLTFWSIKDKNIIKAFGIEKPRGISQTLDKNILS